jgi:uncharacterized protein YgfB (UPF0149 family)
LQQISHQELELELRRSQLGISASELHGAITGIICASGAIALDGLWSLVLDEGPPAESVSTLAATLAGNTIAWLTEGNMEFQPLLPDDTQALPERTDELGLWCQGFLAGIGSGGRAAGESADEQVGEVLEDFSQLARAGFEEEAEDSDEAESAFTEIVEYVRVGVQLTFECLGRGQQPASNRVH